MSTALNSASTGQITRRRRTYQINNNNNNNSTYNDTQYPPSPKDIVEDSNMARPLEYSPEDKDHAVQRLILETTPGYIQPASQIHKPNWFIDRFQKLIYGRLLDFIIFMIVLCLVLLLIYFILYLLHTVIEATIFSYSYFKSFFVESIKTVDNSYN